MHKFLKMISNISLRQTRLLFAKIEIKRRKQWRKTKVRDNAILTIYQLTENEVFTVKYQEGQGLIYIFPSRLISSLLYGTSYYENQYNRK